MKIEGRNSVRELLKTGKTIDKILIANGMRGTESEALLKDIKKMKKIVNSKYYAYPFGEYNKDMLDALKENDYKMAFTFGPGEEHRKASKKDDKYLIPRLNISNDMPLWKYILRILLP